MASTRTDNIRELRDRLNLLLGEEHAPSAKRPGDEDYASVLTSIQKVVQTLIPGTPLSAIFHDGQVHDPLGGGAYAFENGIAEPFLRALLNDEKASAFLCGSDNPRSLPTRPIVIHAGLQPNNSPHIGTLVVFCLAFAFAREIRGRMKLTAAAEEDTSPSVTVLITFVDTAPVKDQGIECDGIQYQRSYRDVPDALDMYITDYQEVLGLLSTWSSVPSNTAFQSDLFSSPSMPSLVDYMISQRAILGPLLSPKYGSLAIRSACPIPGCGLVDKHGRRNEYETNDGGRRGSITFHCPRHGPHTVRLSHREEVARLEANAPTRNLLRSMSHLLDTRQHHIRVTGADYAGLYQEMLLYRPLAAWSAATGAAGGRTPHILYAPLITDWSGAKMSKSLYVRENAYGFMEQLGMDGFCSYAQLRNRFGGDGGQGLRRVWDEVQKWVADPKKLFRTFSLAYLKEVIMQETPAR
ncbi:hypothetical protein F4802DRAFT_268741 [Xylaria palmicola]|nr:hypothetical protein F4802DRAFT_268741 [Xylaria palmicola]